MSLREALLKRLEEDIRLAPQRLLENMLRNRKFAKEEAKGCLQNRLIFSVVALAAVIGSIATDDKYSFWGFLVLLFIAAVLVGRAWTEYKFYSREVDVTQEALFEVSQRNASEAS
jgi:hypothetical protein